MWATILKPMRTMLAASNVHESFWPYAAAHATYLHNIMPSTRLAGEISPYQAKYGMRPDVSKASRRMSVPTGKPHRWSAHGAAGGAGSGGKTMNNTEKPRNMHERT
jgi:hypothetical protein